MEARIGHVCSRWKFACLGLLLALTPTVARLTAAELTDADALRQQAVSQYIDGATKELEAYGQKISATSRAINEQECREAKAKLDECTTLLTELKTADTDHFDLVKASYERTRDELVKALEAAESK
jgi:UDP-N-acetylmuramyl pentapeptide synthase